MDPSIKHYRFAQKKILQNTHFLVILSLLLVYSMQVSIFVLLVAQFFKKSKKKKNKLFDKIKINSNYFSKHSMPEYFHLYYG